MPEEGVVPEERLGPEGRIVLNENEMADEWILFVEFAGVSGVAA
ncbi:hypothetical protein [Streptomyces umbrinus]